MPTLIWTGDSSGTPGRCDSRCHNAKGAECLCVCGGRYHGAARDGTLEQKVMETGDEVIAELEKQGLQTHLRQDRRMLKQVDAIVSLAESLSSTMDELSGTTTPGEGEAPESAKGSKGEIPETP